MKHKKENFFKSYVGMCILSGAFWGFLMAGSWSGVIIVGVLGGIIGAFMY